MFKVKRESLSPMWALRRKIGLCKARAAQRKPSRNYEYELLLESVEYFLMAFQLLGLVTRCYGHRLRNADTVARIRNRFRQVSRRSA